MTDEQINMAIAEACGWEVQLSLLQSGLEIVRDGKRKPLPNYCADLNAMHEAEKSLNKWRMHLYTTYVGAFMQDVCHATAREKAKAFLRTLGKWEATDKDSLTVQSAFPPETRITVNGKTFLLADIEKEMA